MTQGPATTYAEITREVHALVRRFQAGNDSGPAAYMIARAALLQIRDIRGPEKATEAAYSLGDEMSTTGIIDKVWRK